jgi:hypothetical protein
MQRNWQHVGNIAPTLRQAQGRPEQSRGASESEAWPFDGLRANLSEVEGWQALGVGPRRKEKK